MDNKNTDGYSYTYSAKEQEEVRSIRAKYTQKAEVEGKMERLRRLDTRVTQKAQTVALVLGVIGALILGIGMSLVMTDLGDILGDYNSIAMPIGVGIGLVGCVLVGVAYPVYNAILKKERQKIAPEIIRLTDELMK